MEVALLSDTHVPTREETIPDPFRDRIAAADRVVHAGDVESHETIADIRALAEDLTAVFGNADPVDTGLPAVADLAVGAVTVVVTHGMTNHVQAAVFDHGNVLTREDWLAAVADTARARADAWDDPGRVVGVAGHTHQVEDAVHEGVRVLNPGTATGAAPAEQATMMTLHVDGTAVRVERHEA